MKLLGFKRINIEVLLKLIILLGFSFFFYNIIKTGKVLNYVTPRSIPYIKFGIVALITLSLTSLHDLFKPTRNVNIKPYLFFIIPLCMAFTIPIAAVSSKSLTLISTKSISQTNKTNKTTTSKKTSIKGTSELTLNGNTIIVNDNNFVKWTDEISNNMVKYDGKDIVLTGFVFKAEGFKDNEFVPARLEMTCCVLDLEPIGLLSYYNKAKDLKQDTWVIVTGKIKLIENYGEKTPAIIVASVKNTTKPKMKYVYPF